MNKGELVEAVASRLDLPKKQVDRTLTELLEVIMETVASGDKVALVGFGTIEPRDRQGRTGRNPSTGEVIQIAATRVPAFSAGKVFKEKVA